MSYTKEEAIEFIHEHDVKFVKLSFCDPFGTLKNISLLASHIDDAFEHGVCFDASCIEGFGNAGGAELYLFPIPETLTLLPWRPSHGRVARMMCRLCNPDGTPFALDGRELLRIATRRALEAGVLLNIRAECEFYLFKTDDSGLPTNTPSDFAGYLDVNPADKGENVRRDICLTPEEMGVMPESSHHEAGPGQNEIDFRYGDPLTSADNVITFRNVVSSVSANYGLWATFAPKPIPDKPGNGFHINFTVYHFPDRTPAPDTGEAFMAGILDHIRGLTAFLNPTPASYERMGTFKSPSQIGFSQKHHNLLITLPALAGDGQLHGDNFKLRSADSSSSPYLAYTLLIYAGLDGIARKLTLPQALNADTTDALPLLPQSLDEAIGAAKEDRVILDALGKTLAGQILDIYENSGR